MSSRWHGSYAVVGPIQLLIFLLSRLVFGAETSPRNPAWIQYLGDGRVVLRTVIPLTLPGVCPKMSIDGQASEMGVRFAPSLPDFPVQVCEGVLPEVFTKVQVGGQVFGPPKRDVKRVAVIGDTGCIRKRKKKKRHENQNCTDPKSWPFPEIAAQLKAWNPDVIIHVGDYVYRESLCPMDRPDCQDGELRDRWAAWNEDFFKPVAPALASASWAFVRGNHEKCQNAGPGWLAFLDPALKRVVPNAAKVRKSPSCEPFGQPYWISLGRLGILVLDTSNESELEADEGLRKKFKAQLAPFTGRASSAQSVWIASHKPFWAVEPSDQGRSGLPLQMSVNLMDAALSLPKESFQLVLSGHVHGFEALSFEDKRASQLVVGTGGAGLHLEKMVDLKTQTFAGSQPKVGIHRAAHGFVTLEQEPNQTSWTVSQRSVEGKVLTQCKLVGQELTQCVHP